MLKVAILDDYAGLAKTSADWDSLSGIAEVTVFPEHLSEDGATSALWSFDVLCTMRERMALPRSLLQRLPNLKLILIVGAKLANLDLQAATDHGVLVCHSDHESEAYRSVSNATPEFAWGLMIATVRNLAKEDARMRRGLWQGSSGMLLQGKTLGLLGLGRVGRRMARYAHAFDMPIIAWSQNLTDAQAAAEGAVRVSKQELFARADIVSIHVRLSDRTCGLVGADAFAAMKRGAYLINTSRGPIVDEAALVAALTEERIAGAGLDVFDREPLPANHPFRSMGNVTLSPHLGYNTHETLCAYYGDMPEAIAAFARGMPIRMVNPEASRRR